MKQHLKYCPKFAYEETELGQLAEGHTTISRQGKNSNRSPYSETEIGTAA